MPRGSGDLKVSKQNRRFCLHLPLWHELQGGFNGIGAFEFLLGDAHCFTLFGIHFLKMSHLACSFAGEEFGKLATTAALDAATQVGLLRK